MRNGSSIQNSKHCSNSDHPKLLTIARRGPGCAALSSNFGEPAALSSRLTSFYCGLITGHFLCFHALRGSKGRRDASLVQVEVCPGSCLCNQFGQLSVIAQVSNQLI
jgi:hypothetical protein